MNRSQIKLNLSGNQYYNVLKCLSYSKLSNYISGCELEAVTPIEDNDAFRFGRAFHVMFLSRLIRKPQNVESHKMDLRTNAGKELKASLEGLDYFKNNELESAELMCSRFFNSYGLDPAQKELIEKFRSKGLVEVSILWFNEIGLEMKSRLDCVILDKENRTAHVLDLKTDGNMKRDQNKLYWKYRDMNYDLQMYMYSRALASCGYETVTYHTLSIEKETGFYCLFQYGTFDFTDSNSYKNEAFNSGEKKYIQALGNYLKIEEKIKNNVSLSASIFSGVPELNHPAYENGD